MKLVLAFLLGFLSLGTSAQWVDDDRRISDEFIVMLQPEVKSEEFLRVFPQLEVKRNVSKRMNIWLMSGKEISSSEDFLLLLQRNRLVKRAQFNHRVEQRGLIPNDTSFHLQWNMYNTGQNGGKIGADIKATEAWALNHNNITPYGDTIVVAVIDGTFDLNHMDINFFRNYQEVPDNGIDDDANGFIDDYEGWNAYDLSGKINKGGTDPHSMHVSGIVGAIGDNQIGVAGTCWGVKILRIAGSSTTEADVVASYDYAIAMRALYNQTAGVKGAFIVATNSSFGVDNGNPVDFPIWCALYDTMGALGILSATATANRPQDVDLMHDIPTECPSNWLIAVTNTTLIDRLNSGSAYGKTSIDIGAPGTSVFSTLSSNGYGIKSGTSMATPHISGSLASMYATACEKLLDDYAVAPDSVALIVKKMLLDGTDQLSDLFNKTSSGGRLNLFHALRNLDEYNCNDCSYSVQKTITQPTCSNTCDGSINLAATGTGLYQYDWGTGFSDTSEMQNLCPGFYSVTVKDANGCLRTSNAVLNRPDSISIQAISTVPPANGNPGNIIVAASAGNYKLQYSLNGVDYQSTATLVVATSGIYNLYVRSESGCVAQRSVIVSGLGDELLINEWSISPNPAQNQLNVSLSLSKSSELKFSVLNLLGQTVISENKEVGGGLHTTMIDIAALPEGTYLLQLSSSSTTNSKLFFVQR